MRLPFCERCMQGRLAQPLTGTPAILFGQVSFEGNRLLLVERLEIPVLGVVLEAGERLRGRVHCHLTVAHRLLQVVEIFSFDSFVVCVVRRHVCASFSKSLFTLG